MAVPASQEPISGLNQCTSFFTGTKIVTLFWKDVHLSVFISGVAAEYIILPLKFLNFGIFGKKYSEIRALCLNHSQKSLVCCSTWLETLPKDGFLPNQKARYVNGRKIFIAFITRINESAINTNKNKKALIEDVPLLTCLSILKVNCMKFT